MEEEEQGLDVGRYFGVLLHWWWVVVLIVALFAVLAYVYSTLTKTTVYRTHATLLIQELSSGVGPSLGNIVAGQQLAITYKELLTTPRMLEIVAEELGLVRRAESLRGQISVSVRTGTPLLDVEVEASDPDSPIQIANTLTQRFVQDRQTTRLAEIARLEALAAAQGNTNTNVLLQAQLSVLASLSIVEEAVIARPIVRPSVRRNVLLAGFLAAFLGILLAFLLEYSSNKLGSKPESTEGRPWGQPLKKPCGCSSESGIMVLEQKPARKQGAPNRCCHRTNPTVSAVLFDDHEPGGQCRPAPAGHPSPAPGPAGTRRPSP